ncbi:hypothetical protein TNCT_587321 [Trichonephila clavata]|uniref:Uncharacterized protein n=1 Tax=Trichonephila clavata TaxID=2740835 RepID=A0A8X6FBC3_TRICU|nr:hypothetical protein TNCT_587321 [Trichonephila clavata]
MQSVIGQKKFVGDKSFTNNGKPMRPFMQSLILVKQSPMKIGSIYGNEIENKNRHDNSQPELTKSDKKENLEETKESTIEIIEKVRVTEGTTPETTENPRIISNRNKVKAIEDEGTEETTPIENSPVFSDRNEVKTIEENRDTKETTWETLGNAPVVSDRNELIIVEDKGAEETTQEMMENSPVISDRNELKIMEEDIGVEETTRGMTENFPVISIRNEVETIEDKDIQEATQDSMDSDSKEHVSNEYATIEFKSYLGSMLSFSLI